MVGKAYGGEITKRQNKPLALFFSKRFIALSKRLLVWIVEGPSYSNAFILNDL